MEEKNTKNNLSEKISQLITAENIQKYVLGSTKSGQPRAIYDIVRDFISPKKKKKKKIKRPGGLFKGQFGLFQISKKKKKKKKNKFPKLFDD